MIFFDALQICYELLVSVFDNVFYLWLEKYTLIRGLLVVRTSGTS